MSSRNFTSNKTQTVVFSPVRWGNDTPGVPRAFGPRTFGAGSLALPSRPSPGLCGTQHRAGKAELFGRRPLLPPGSAVGALRGCSQRPQPIKGCQRPCQPPASHRTPRCRRPERGASRRRGGPGVAPTRFPASRGPREEERSEAPPPPPSRRVGRQPPQRGRPRPPPGPDLRQGPPGRPKASRPAPPHSPRAAALRLSMAGSRPEPTTSSRRAPLTPGAAAKPPHSCRG